jgi:hypothetical protein
MMRSTWQWKTKFTDITSIILLLLAIGLPAIVVLGI